MSTDKEEFDYQAHYRNTPPDSAKLRPSKEAREKRRQGKERITIRLDADILEAFKVLSGGEGWQTLINQALREWLTAQSVRDLLKVELPSFLLDALVALKQRGEQELLDVLEGEAESNDSKEAPGADSAGHAR